MGEEKAVDVGGKEAGAQFTEGARFLEDNDAYSLYIDANTEVLNKGEINTLILEQIAASGGGSGGLPVPQTLALESELPDISTGAGQIYNFLIEDMDVTAPGKQGQAWAGATTWTTFVDLVQTLSTNFFQQNADGQWEIAADIQTLIDGALQASQIETTEPTDESPTNHVTAASRLWAMMGAAFASLSTTAKTIVGAINEVAANIVTVANNLGIHAGNANIHVTTADKDTWNAKQPAITATGTENLLTAPAAAGGQPGTKPVADLMTKQPAVTLTDPTQADIDALGKVLTGTVSLYSASGISRNISGFIGNGLLQIVGSWGTLTISDCSCPISIQVDAATTLNITGCCDVTVGSSDTVTIGTVSVGEVW